MKNLLFLFALLLWNFAQAQPPNLGPDITLCAGDAFPTLSISSDFDDSDFGITWYNNGTLIQTGGVILTAPYVGGEVSIEVEHLSEPVPFTNYESVLVTVTPLTAHAVITNVATYFSVFTHYGFMSVPRISCNGLTIDGSASTCENSYFIDIVPFNPSPGVWAATGASIYSAWHSGQAPSNINIHYSNFPPPNTSGYYLMTFAVGPIWTPHYVLFYYECLK